MSHAPLYNIVKTWVVHLLMATYHYLSKGIVVLFSLHQSLYPPILVLYHHT